MVVGRLEDGTRTVKLEARIRRKRKRWENLWYCVLDKIAQFKEFVEYGHGSIRLAVGRETVMIIKITG